MMFASEMHPDHCHWGLLGICERGVGMCWRPVVLESVSTQVLIRGFVAQVKAKLIYHNGNSHPLQVKAVYPVDEGAAVYHCEARLDGRTIVTQCMERKKAEKVYKEAVDAGKTAVLAEEHEDTSDILNMNLGNLPAGLRAEIELKMVMELAVQTDGSISFVLPTVLNPRYAPPDNPQMQAPQMQDLFFRAHHTMDRVVHVPQPYSMNVKAEVRGTHQIAKIISQTDPLNVTLADNASTAQITQDGGYRCDHDWSLLVYYRNPYEPHLLRETGDRAATGIMRDDLLMLNLFPEIPTDSYSNRNEIIFVIDRSGSMQGPSIMSARATLLLFLKSLPNGCLFNVVSFGNTFSLLFPKGSRVYSQDTLHLACQLQSSMEADMGGTEILRPLQYIYSEAPTPEYSRQILLITDGEVWNVDQVLQLVGRHAHETRLFSVGVGHGASTALVRGAARAGRGRSEMVLEQSLLQQKVMGLVNSMVQESVQRVTIACEVEPASRVTLVPKVPPVIFGGQHLILYARLPHTTKVKSMTVSGQLGSQAVLNKLDGEHFTVVHDEAKSLHRLAARAQIQQWQLDEEENVAEDMVALSVASGVVSRRTALVGVDVESGKPFTYKSSPVTRYYEECSGFPNKPRPLRSASTFGGIQQSSFCSQTPSSNVPFACASQQPASGFGYSSAHSACNLGNFQLYSGSRQLTGAVIPSILADRSIPRRAKLSGGFSFGSSGASQGPDQGGDSGIQPILQGACEAPQLPHHSNLVGGGGGKSPCGLMEVVGLQQFDGSWTLKDAAHLTGLTLDALNANASPVKGEDAWATALVLALLEKKFDNQKNEWALLAVKAKNFIDWCGEQLEELMTKARVLLNSK